MRVRDRERAPHFGDSRRLIRELHHRRGIDLVPLRPQRRHLGIEHHQHRDELAAVADRHRLADDRARLGQRLQVGGRDVLARRCDDQLLFAVDDPEVPVSPEHGDVAGMHPTIRIDHVRRFGRLAVVADHHVAAAHEQLAVVAEAHLDTRKRHSDRWGLVVSERHGSRGARELAHSPHLVKRHSKRRPELVHLGTGWSSAGDGEVHAVKADLGTE